MRTLAFDGRTGASGDMLLGALVAAGADPDVLAPVEAALPVRYRVGTATRNGIAATRVEVLLDEGADVDDGHAHTHDDGHTDHHAGDEDHAHDDHTHSHDGHAHDDHAHPHDGHAHDDDHGHTHHHDGDEDHHDHAHTHAEGAGTTRTYEEVRSLLDDMAVPAPVADDARAVFRLLGEAEAAVHGTEVEHTHFHEVGADDAVADVVGVCLLLADLDVDRVVTTPVGAGGGEVAMSHGTYPVPAPAVVELAERADWSLVGGPVETELLTPTGAALLAHLADGVDALPALSVTASGYGAGAKSFPSHPNVLRAVVGDGGERLRREEITVLETHLDDATPEVLGDLQESLAAVGARDVAVVPTTMKKSRPGHLVKVVTRPADAERVAHRLAVETGTLGVREGGAGHRWVADRRVETVTLEMDGESHDVRVKVGSDADGAVYDVSAEYEDARSVARETGLPLRAVMRRAESAFHDGERDAGEAEE